MSPLHLIASFSDRLGWVLLHSTWQFVLIALVALALQRIVRDGAAMVRYGLLLVALATMPLLPIVTWIVLPQPPSATGTAGSANWPDAERRDWRERTVAAAEPADAGQSTAPPAVARPAGAADVAESSRAATQETAREPATAAAWRHGLERRLRPWLPSLVAFWCAGVLVFSLRPLLSWYAVQRLRRVGVSAVPQSIRILLDRAAERLRVWQHVELLQSARVGTPVLVGVFRPIILLPMNALTGVPAVHLEAILVHELAHVRRHDYLVNVVQTLLETIFFYHPAVWWLSHQIRREREHCCDDVAVAALGSPVEYGRALLALEEQRDAAAVLAIGAGDGALLSRIRRLRSTTPNVPAWQMTTLAGSAAFPALLMAVGVWSLTVAQENQQGQGSAVGAQPVMSDDEQWAWRALDETGATIYGEAARQGHRRRHLESLQRSNFPETRLQEIREQLVRPIRSASLWQVSEQGWPLVARLESLQELVINSSDMGGEAFRHIAALPNLRRLTVGGSKCLPADAAHLKRATTLERIEITFTIFEEPAERRRELLGEPTDAEQAWAEAHRTRSSGREHIIEAAILTDRMLDELRDLPNLKTLRLTNTSISPRGAEAIAAHAGLEELDVSLVDSTPDAAHAIGQLTQLRKFRTANASDETLEALAGLTAIEELELWAGEVTDAGLRHLKPLRSLRSLELRGSSISDRGLLELATLPRLERLDLRHATGPLTPAGLAEFQRLRPQCQVIAGTGEDSVLPPDGERSSTPAPEGEIGTEAVIQSSGEHATAVAPERPLKIWKVRLVDGENDQPVEGIRVSARPGADAPPIMLTSDARGLLEVPLPPGTATTLKVETPGWWSEMFPVVGEAKPDRQSPAASEADVREPAAAVTHKLWRGTIVRGRLLRPAGEPAAGIALTVGVYINSQQWKERLRMDLTWYSFDHGQWPNWTIQLVTDEAGRFETTVPPPDARSWVRVSTGKELTDFAPSEWEWPGEGGFEREGNLGNGVYFRDLQLEHGVTLRGRVLDAEDHELPGVTLHTTGKRGPYDGRNAVSGDKGQFKFLPMKPGSLTIRPDARLRDETGKIVSRDVSAVFIPQTLTLPDTDEPVEMMIRAVPHVTLEFEWIDRRAEKGPVAYYGAFRVRGQVPTEDGSTILWSGETARTRRDGKEILFVKVPRSIQDPILTLPADRVVTASYEDDLWIAGPGTVNLGDVTEPQRRIIYGDEPRER